MALHHTANQHYYQNGNNLVCTIHKFKSTGLAVDDDSRNEFIVVGQKQTWRQVARVWPRTRGFRDLESACAQELDISIATLHRILTICMLTECNLLKNFYQQVRHSKDSTDWIIEQQNVNSHFVDKIIFSGGVNFHLDDFVNRHNHRIWGLEKLLRREYFPKVSVTLM